MDDLDSRRNGGVAVELSPKLGLIAYQEDRNVQTASSPDRAFDRGLRRVIPAHGIKGDWLQSNDASTAGIRTDPLHAPTVDVLLDGHHIGARVVPARGTGSVRQSQRPAVGALDQRGRLDLPIRSPLALTGDRMSSLR
jgi:hypothetical protein